MLNENFYTKPTACEEMGLTATKFENYFKFKLGIFCQTLANHLPISIEEKITRQNNEGKEEIEYSNNPCGASYFWLVKFDNGHRLPYPLLNLEGTDSTPFTQGNIEKTTEKMDEIIIKEKIISRYFQNQPELKNAFEKLQTNTLKQQK